MAFAPDGRYVAAVGADAVVRVWDVETKSEVRGLRGHTDWVTAVALSPDGRYVASVGVEKDAVLRIFELPPLDVSATGGHLLAVKAVAVSPDGKLAATAANDQTIKLWDIATGKHVGTLIGNVFIWGGGTFYDVYETGDDYLGLSPSADQSLAGSIMMLEGSLVTIVAIAWLFLRMAQEGEIRQGLIERGIDERTARRAVRYRRWQELGGEP